VKSLKFFSRRLTRAIARRLQLEQNLFHQNQLKLEAAKAKSQELVDVMPGILNIYLNLNHLISSAIISSLDKLFWILVLTLVTSRCFALK